MDELTRERFGPRPRALRPELDDIDLIIERRQILLGEDVDRAEAEKAQTLRLRAERLKRERRLVKAIRRARESA